MKKIPLKFYRRSDVAQVAKELLGKLLVSTIGNKKTIGRIVEVEAYNGIVDKASHAFNGKRTKRTSIMFADGGVAYIYLCYGIHHLFNVVTSNEGDPKAILIRALEPVAGFDVMLKRTDKRKQDSFLTSGPGKLSKALGISISQNGQQLNGNTIYLADDGVVYSKNEILSSPRIGIDYAEEDALLPYRFYKANCNYVSGNSK